MTMNKKDLILEIIEEKDSYSARKLYNLYVFTLDISIYEFDKIICKFEEDNFNIKLVHGEVELEYNSDSKDKNDKKIHKFLKRFVEKEDLDYNIVISNVINVFKYQNLDFTKLEVFKTKIQKENGSCIYEF